MKPNLQSKLKTYSALAGASAIVGAAQGQIKYTDINPDTTFTGSGQYDLDLNNDMSPDFRLRIDTLKTVTTGTASTWYQTNDTIEIQPLGVGNDFVSNGSSYARAMNSGSAVDAYGNWASSAQYLGIYFRLFAIGSISTGITTTYGSWQNKSNAYLGLRLVAGTDTTYGWARLSVNGNLSSFTIKDYAYQSWPNLPIDAGDSVNVYTQMASSVVGTDVSNNGNGFDLEVAFNKAANETGIAEYRIYVVKSLKSANFNIDSAKTVASGNYTVHVPNGSNYQSVLGATAKDTDGNFIANNVPYKVFVMSVPDGNTTNAPSMVGPSNEVTLVPNTFIEELSSMGLKFRQSSEKIVVSRVRGSGNFNVVLSNLSGQQVRQNSGDQSDIDISTKGLSAGVYIVKVNSGSKSVQKKFMVH